MINSGAETATSCREPPLQKLFPLPKYPTSVSQLHTARTESPFCCGWHQAAQGDRGTSKGWDVTKPWFSFPIPLLLQAQSLSAPATGITPLPFHGSAAGITHSNPQGWGSQEPREPGLSSNSAPAKHSPGGAAGDAAPQISTPGPCRSHLPWAAPTRAQLYWLSAQGKGFQKEKACGEKRLIGGGGSCPLSGCASLAACGAAAPSRTSERQSQPGAEPEPRRGCAPPDSLSSSPILLEKCRRSGEGTKQAPRLNPLPPGAQGGWKSTPSKHQHHTALRFLFQSPENPSPKNKSNHEKKENNPGSSDRAEELQAQN